MVILCECQDKKNKAMLYEKRDALPPREMMEVTRLDSFYAVN